MNDANWDDLRLFLAVAEHGGLSGAVDATGMSAPTLGRRMLALEASLGRALFARHAKGYDLTPEGVDLLRQASGLKGQIEAMTTPRDSQLVKISAGLWTTRLLCERATALSDPSVTLQFAASDLVFDIPHREAAIGIRNHRPDHVGLAVQRTAAVTFARYGTPDTPWVQVMGATPSANWVRDNAPSATIEVTHPLHALDLARSGAAQAVLPRFIADAEAGLTCQSDDITDLTHDRWIVSHNTDRFIPHVRRTIDRLVAILAE